MSENINMVDALYKTIYNQDQQIAELQKQLEEKEKDNQFLKKMYLSEKTKNDNYHTEKYALDKPVEELRKIKLTPKEKEIYYKGFDNCERQFATHIVELQKQLEEKKKEIEKLRKLHSIRDDASQCEIVNGVKFNAEQIMIIALLKENMTLATNEYKKLYFDSINRIKELENQLKSQSAEIVEKIRNLAGKDFDFDICTCCGEDVHDDVVLTKNDFNKILDKVLKEYQK